MSFWWAVVVYAFCCAFGACAGTLLGWRLVQAHVRDLVEAEVAAWFADHARRHVDE